LGSTVRQRLALKGSKVLAVDINHKTVIEEDTELKSRVSFITGDVSDRRFLSDLFAKYRKCDAVVNCAAAYKSYNYLTSYLVAKHALEVMKNNEINEFGVRGCVLNIIGLQDKYDDKYFEEQDIYAKKMGESYDTIDDKVMALAQELTDHRIRSNSVIVPPNSDLKLLAKLIENIVEDQYIAGQVINMHDESRPQLGTLKEIMAAYHVPPDPKTRQLPEPVHEKERIQIASNAKPPVLRLGSDTHN